jgi:hypothetical protein
MTVREIQSQLKTYAAEILPPLISNIAEAFAVIGDRGQSPNTRLRDPARFFAVAYSAAFPSEEPADPGFETSQQTFSWSL